MPRALQISDSEWAVMEPIWQQGVCTAAEVINRLAPRTIGTTAPFARCWRGCWKKGA